MIEMESYNGTVELGAEGDFTPELQFQIFTDLEECLKLEQGTLTDDELVMLTRETSQGEGWEDDIFTGAIERPKVYYRAFQNTEQVQELFKNHDVMLRPFSYAQPGKWIEEKSADLPLSYGGTKPLLIRIIDTSGEFEDTGQYWGFGKNWVEAFTLGKVVLHKVGEEIKSEVDLYKQVGLEASGQDEIPQFTYILDRLATKEAQDKMTLEDFANDAGWWNEIANRAKGFSASNNEFMQRLNRKYLEYFDQTLNLPLEKSKTKDSSQALETAKVEISRLVKRLLDTEQNDKSWSPETIRATLGSFSHEAWQGYFDIVVPRMLGESPRLEEKEKFFEERTKAIENKTGLKLERKDFKL